MVGVLELLSAIGAGVGIGILIAFALIGLMIAWEKLSTMNAKVVQMMIFLLIAIVGIMAFVQVIFWI